MHDDIGRWLDELGLGEYASVFAENHIDGELLASLGNDDLKDLGIASLGHRKKLLAAIAELSDAQTAPAAAEQQRGIVIPERIAERIAADADERLGERKFVTILFADIYQSTTLTEDLDPEDARKLLDDTIDHMAAAVHRYDGMVNKVLGDGIMALFGAPLALEDHAVRACYAALFMQETLRAFASDARREFGAQIQARIGLHSGEVVVRAIKNDFGIDYDATGSSVHIAARMEQSTEPGTIRVSHDTWRLVRDLVHAPTLGPLSVKGLKAPLEVHELQGAGVAATRHAATARNQSPFIGRRQEFSLLQQIWQSAGRRRGQTVIYSGEAGVGKSRLYQEFLNSLPVAEARVLRGSFNIHGKASPFQALVSLLSDYFGIEALDSPDQLRERLSAGLAAFANGSANLRTPFLALFQVAIDDDEAWRLADPMQRRRRTLNALIEFFSLLAARSRLALVFEDLQRADSDSLALFEELIEFVVEQPILLLLNHRNEFTHAWPNPEHCQLRELPPLEADFAGDLLDEMLGEDEVLDDLKSILIARSGGNPLFLEEALGELLESGVLAGAPGQRTMTAAVESLQTPGTVQGIVAARIDRLAPIEKQILQIAAVMGDDVPVSLLEQMVDMPLDDARAAVVRLVGFGYLFEANLFPDIVYRFNSTFVQQVAYDGILKSRRRQLHGRLAHIMEARYGVRVTEVAETLAHHFEKGGVRARAIKYLMLASEKAEAGYQFANAAALCRRAALLAVDQEDLGHDRCLALARQGDLVSLLGEWQRANELYDQAKALAVDDRFVQDIDLRHHNYQTVEHDGARLGYLRHGTGDEVLMFVVPGAYNHALFQPLIPVFCQGYRVVMVQLLGQGASDPPRPGQTLKDNARDLAAVARTLEGRITGIGISRASNMLAHAAIEHPGLFDRLVFVAAPADDGVEGSRFPRPAQFVSSFRAAVAAEDWHQVATLHAVNLVPEPEAHDLRGLIMTTMINAPRNVVRHFFDSNPDMDITGLVGDLPMPVLVMHGNADTQAPFSGSEYLAEQTPKGQHYVFEGKGHLPMQTATKEFCAALSNFLTATR